ncbi:uncharacterized protein LOC122264714 [Penaeus japonicus]|uniref:uncharacterized protein LOC122264714 n=1 Tax=Penaeus japonicus TaxID=27405 RepID=UPI001C71701B|nr:uncharacterized protein LOC122264714 [Penaeus japonicus]
MKLLTLVLVAALACASPVEKREADAEPSFLHGYPGYGYGYPTYYRGYGYPNTYGLHYGHDLHKRSVDEDEAEPSYVTPIHSHQSHSFVGHDYSSPYHYGYLHKRSADPEVVPSYHSTIYNPYGRPYNHGYPYHPIHKRSADPEIVPSYQSTTYNPYERPYNHGYPYHPIHKRSADPEAEAEPSY